MRNTLDIECLVQSFQNVIDAQSNHSKARDAFIASGGYSWGYYGQDYVDAMENAAEDLQNRLNEYIEKKVIEILEKRHEITM